MPLFQRNHAYKCHSYDLARVKIIEEGGWQSLQSASVGLDQTVALRYPPPAYVTGELSFGDANAEPSFMWVKEEDPEINGLDKLTAINLRISGDDLLEGIQLVFNRSGGSPMF